jgi:hypothetical protein
MDAKGMVASAAALRDYEQAKIGLSEAIHAFSITHAPSRTVAESGSNGLEVELELGREQVPVLVAAQQLA